MSSPDPLTHCSVGKAAIGSPSSTDSVSRISAEFFLQFSQRAGAVALLATIGAWVMMYQIRDFHVPLAIACGSADAGLCSALVARMFCRPNTAHRREANGVAIFNLVFFVLALYLMIFARLELIRSAASQFFTPTPPAFSTLDVVTAACTIAYSV